MASKDKLLSILAIGLHTIWVTITMIGFWALDPLVPVAGTNTENTVLDIIFSLLHGVLCLVPTLVLLQAMLRGRTRGTKRATIVSCSLVLVVQAAKLASLAYGAMSSTSSVVGPWVATLTCIGMDVLSLVVFLTVSLSLRLDTLSGQTDVAFPLVLIFALLHFIASTAGFLMVADLNIANTYVTFAGGLSVLYAVLLFLGLALFPAYYVHLRATLDGQFTTLEWVLSLVWLVPSIAMNCALIAIAHLIYVGNSELWAVYFALAVPAIDILLCFALAVVITHKWRALRNFDPQLVELRPGSAAMHNDL